MRRVSDLTKANAMNSFRSRVEAPDGSEESNGDIAPVPSHRYAVRRHALEALHQPMSLEDLAGITGVTDSRLLWHLRQMREAGEVTGEENHLWSRTAHGASVVESIASNSAHRAIPDRVVEDFDDAFLEKTEGLFGSREHQASGEHRTRLSSEQAAEFRDRLLDLINEYFAPGKGDRAGTKYGLHWVLTPIDLHPLDDTKAVLGEGFGTKVGR
jgi:hypothetical protein